MDRASRGAKPEYPEATMRCFLHLRLHDFLVLTDALSHIRTDVLYRTRLTFLGAVQRTIRPSDRWILPVRQVRVQTRHKTLYRSVHRCSCGHERIPSQSPPRCPATSQPARICEYFDPDSGADHRRG